MAVPGVTYEEDSRESLSMTLDKQIRIGFMTMLLIIIILSGFSVVSLYMLKHAKSRIGDNDYTLGEIISNITESVGKDGTSFDKEGLFNVIKETDSEIGMAYTNMFTIAVLAILFGGIITIMFPRRVTKPVMNLVEATVNVREGDYSYRVKNISGTDEIAKLVSSFNKMLNSIELEHRELEKRNVDLEDMNLLNSRLLEEAKNFNRILEEKVSEVKQVLENKHRDFLKTEKLATIGEIATRIAHEIRNPLSGIAVALENLRIELSETTQKDRVTEIISEVNRLDNIIKELFQLAIPRELSLVPGNPNDLIDRVASMVSLQAALRSVEIEKIPAEKIRDIYLDYKIMQQVIMNLVLNAIESIEGHDGKVVIKSYYSDDEFNIEITDNGSGISEMYQRRIFEPFFSTKKNGTGLGLAITKQIIELHKGTIRAESTDGVGTKFFIILPANLGEDYKTTESGGKENAQNDIIDRR